MLCPTEPAALCNPDVMIAAADTDALGAGDFHAIVGDLHAFREILTHSSIAPLVHDYAPDALAEVSAAYQALLEPGEVLVDVIRTHAEKTEVQLAYPGRHLEIVGRSPKDRHAVLEPRHLRVTISGGRLLLTAQDTGERLRLLAPLASGSTIQHDPLAVFSFPRRFDGPILDMGERAHRPRIRAGRIVLARETWRLPVERLRGQKAFGNAVSHDDPSEFYAACRLREAMNLPRHVFAIIPGEPKPLYVDLTSPILVRQLYRRVRGTSGTIVFSEMLPSPDGRWLTIDGQRFTSELRYVAFSRGVRRRSG